MWGHPSLLVVLHTTIHHTPKQQAPYTKGAGPGVVGIFPGLFLGNSVRGVRLELSVSPSFLRPFFVFFEDERRAGATFKDASAPGIGDRPRRLEGFPLRAGSLVRGFSSMGGAKSPKEAGVEGKSFSDDVFCVIYFLVRPSTNNRMC